MSDDDFEAVRQMVGARWGKADNVYQADPVLWIRKNGEEVWSQQRHIMESVRDNRYTAVHSAHDLGKSFIASRIIAWWIDTHPPGTAFVVSTAPSAAQVSAIMWREVGKIHKAAGLPGRINRAGYPQWYLEGELVGYGRKPADYEQSAFQGIHAEFVLVVIDEACGVSQHLYDAVDSLATNENARVLAIGNPDDPASHFAHVCQPDSGWEVIHLDGLRSPNITEERVIGPDPTNPKYPLLAALMEAEGIPYSTEKVPKAMRPMLINEQWIEERIQRWANVGPSMLANLPWPVLCEKVRTSCEGSNLFTAKVRGIFPTSASEGVIPLGWVQRAVERWRDLQGATNPSEVAATPGDFVLGVDVARTGDDETCFAHRYGSYVTKIEHFRITDTMEVADRAATYLYEPRSMCVVDVIGIGAGVYDALRRFKSQAIIVGTPVPFNAAGQTNRRDRLGQFRFLNDRAAAWWNLREMLDPSRGSNLALPDDETMIEELVSPKWVHHVGGKIKVESKEDIKRRIGRSTDAADALIAAFWVSGDHHQEPFVPWAKGSRPSPGGAVIPYGEFEADWESLVGVSNVDFSDL
jgi:hypothetical protein